MNIRGRIVSILLETNQHKQKTHMHNTKSAKIINIRLKKNTDLVNTDKIWRKQSY